MEKVTITKEMLQDYYKRWKKRRQRPQTLFCKLCTHLARGTRQHPASYVGYFNEGDPAYKITFRNGTEGYYHIDCFDNPKDEHREWMIENIKKQEYIKT